MIAPYDNVPSKWIITNDYLTDDINVINDDDGDIVYISKAAFTNAVPKKTTLNGLKGTYFSNRLYDAVLRYATKNGTDIGLIDNIFRTRFDCSIKVNDYAELTKGITDETAVSFEMFKAEELLAILEMFEEMPEGLHKVKNLDYLIRRVDGDRNPIYPDAAAVSWCDAENGYIEFMDSAFTGDYITDTFRLILHEKTHFLWANEFSEDLKSAWIKTGGWYTTDTDYDGWATTKQTEFVTQYAHKHNPDEDMAESVAYYIINPDKLESRSSDKYNFIKNYIMNGSIYLAQIREDLTFEVYNLYPDYKYPGRIVDLKAEVIGEPEDDKQVTVTIKLDTQDLDDYGAQNAIMRIEVENGQFYDLWLHPVDDDTSTLSGTITMSKYSCAGMWYCDSITLTDLVGNQRFEGVNDFGWKLYIDNPLADNEKPQFVYNSMNIELVPSETEGHKITYANIHISAKDNVGIRSVYCALANETHDSYAIEKYSDTNDDPDKTDFTVIIPLTEYHPSGEYAINRMQIIDFAGNTSAYGISDIISENRTFNFESDLSDYEPPELDLNNIKVSAYPTHPENPNGETVVNIEFYAKDNASGLGIASYRLLDSMGVDHFEYFYHENFYTLYFDGDPTQWKKYTISVVLPEGSAPGIWGLMEINLCDKAGNFKTYNFLEIVHFVIDDAETSNSELYSSSDTVAANKTIQLSIPDKKDDVEYTWECINGTGSAIVDKNGKLTGLTSGTVKVVAYSDTDKDSYFVKQITILDKSDVAVILKYISGTISHEEFIQKYDISALDYNKNDKIEITDAIEILKAVSE
jgi:hypothetical protein